MAKGRIQSLYIPHKKESVIQKAKIIAKYSETSFNKYVLQSIQEKLEREKWLNTMLFLEEDND